jgi:hypothetical protein
MVFSLSLKLLRAAQQFYRLQGQGARSNLVLPTKNAGQHRFARFAHRFGQGAQALGRGA